LVSCYAHVFVVLLLIVIATLPLRPIACKGKLIQER